MKKMIKSEYKSLKKNEIEKIIKFIEGKCIEYYFLGYLRCSNGNVDDAIEFYLLDDKLRSLFAQYLIRFEIQIKSDFAKFVGDSTHSNYFWKYKKYYIKEATFTKSNTKKSKYSLIKRKIQANISRLNFNGLSSSISVAMYSSSFGTFQELFKLIDTNYKQDFVNKYTSRFNAHSYKLLNCYLESIRRIRNRCAHGNHIITLKMVNDLFNLKTVMFSNSEVNKPNVRLTVMESTILFLIHQLNCGNEFRHKFISIIKKFEKILKKYNGKHSLSGTTLNKLS